MVSSFFIMFVKKNKMELYEQLAEIILKGINSKNSAIHIRGTADELRHFGDIEDDVYSQILKDSELIKNYLVKREYIKYSEYKRNFYLTELGEKVKKAGGTIQYHQKLAAFETNNNKKNIIYNLIKDIIIPSVAVLISIFAFLQGCSNNTNTHKLEKKIDSIQMLVNKYNYND